MNAPRRIRIAVIGPADADADTLAQAEAVGFELARHHAILLCGGLGGVMRAAAMGARRGGGFTVGILPGPSAAEANPFIDLPIVTGLGEARNLIIIRSAAAVIAVAGAYGTLSEIAFALKLNVPVVGLHTWQLRSPDGHTPPIIGATDPADAVARALRVAAGD